MTEHCWRCQQPFTGQGDPTKGFVTMCKQCHAICIYDRKCLMKPLPRSQGCSGRSPKCPGHQNDTICVFCAAQKGLHRTHR